MYLGKNGEEMRVKRQWLFSFIAYYSFTFIVMLIACAALFGKYGFQQYLASSIAVAVFHGASAYCVYYSAYRKRGIIWLSIILIMLPLDLIKNIIERLNTFDYSLFWFMILGVFEIYFWINCFRLRALNKKLRVLKKKSRKQDDQSYMPMEQE